MMTRIFTISSGAAMPNTACSTMVQVGSSVRPGMAANSARGKPSREMLAAPSRKDTQTSPGGPGRSSAAMTSQSTSKAGATAAMPITVGSDSRVSMMD